MYKYIIVTMFIVLVILGIKLMNTEHKLKLLLVESEIIKISNSSLVEGINKQSSAIRDIETKQKDRQVKVDKTIIKVETKYVDRYKLVHDLNETEECKALQRIIDEETNSSDTNSSI